MAKLELGWIPCLVHQKIVTNLTIDFKAENFIVFLKTFRLLQGFLARACKTISYFMSEKTEQTCIF